LEDKGRLEGREEIMGEEGLEEGRIPGIDDCRCGVETKVAFKGGGDTDSVVGAGTQNRTPPPPLGTELIPLPSP